MNIDEFMGRIARVESGNPNAVNKDSGAHGTYQIMPANWPSWSKEAGLGANAPKTAANQERVARFKMQQYFNQYGSWGAVAAAWYGGGKAAAKYAANPNDPYLIRKHGKYPSIRDYVSRVLGGAASTASAGGKKVRATPQPDDTTVAPEVDDDEAEAMNERKTWEYQMASLSSIMTGVVGGTEAAMEPDQRRQVL